MDLTLSRQQPEEQVRVRDLLDLIPAGAGGALDVGARDGYITRLIAGRQRRVTALDLSLPEIDDPRIDCVAGNITALAFPDRAFDLVVCSEVLEHIVPLQQACAELARVAGRYLLIGVPYRQDIRLDRSTCQQCGKGNPPWGHVNSFDEARLRGLFPGFALVRQSLAGTPVKAATNALSCRLMDLAGNPYGTYDQDESCIHCGGALGRPPPRSLWQKCLTRGAVYARRASAPFVQPRPKWIHALFERAAG